MRRKRCIALFGIILAGLLTTASLAWACTATMGALTLSPTSGAPGASVKASAKGLKVYPAKYRLLFKRSTGLSCMSSTEILKDNIVTTTAGTFAVYVTVPATAPRGPSEICGMENTPVKNQTGTSHASFTVL